MVNGIVLRSPLPVTVKIRSGENAKKARSCPALRLLLCYCRFVLVLHAIMPLAAAFAALGPPAHQCGVLVALAFVVSNFCQL